MTSGGQTERLTVVFKVAGGHCRRLEQLTQKCSGRNQVALPGASSSITEMRFREDSRPVSHTSDASHVILQTDLPGKPYPHFTKEGAKMKRNSVTASVLRIRSGFFSGSQSLCLALHHMNQANHLHPGHLALFCCPLTCLAGSTMAEGGVSAAGGPLQASEAAVMTRLTPVMWRPALFCVGE